MNKSEAFDILFELAEAHGFSPKEVVYDGLETEGVSDWGDAKDAILAVDEATLVFEPDGWMFFALDVAPHEIVNNHPDTDKFNALMRDFDSSMSTEE